MATKTQVEQIPGEKELTLLRDEIYGGSWDRMLADLRARLNQRPYIPKLFTRIRNDIATIEELKAMGKT